MAQAALVLEMFNIAKSFPGVRALDGLSFDCAAGDVHALCGENGAVKSTLIKILGGVYQRDGGSIPIEGRDVAFAHPSAARSVPTARGGRWTHVQVGQILNRTSAVSGR